MDIKEKGVLVQIGTNNGADEFNEIVRKSSPVKIVLVEPNKALNSFVYKNYEGVENVILENVAITERDGDEVELVHPIGITDGMKESGAVYTTEHFSLLPLDDWGSDLVRISTRTMTFNTLCKKHGIDHVHYLQIDTEGYDSEIIKSIDFDKIKIDIIKYEDWSFPEDCFSRYGEDRKKYGVNGMRDVKALLESRGYALTTEARDIIAVKI